MLRRVYRKHEEDEVVNDYFYLHVHYFSTPLIFYYKEFENLTHLFFSLALRELEFLDKLNWKWL